MGLAEVSNVLWRERELLELLLFKLEEEQLLIATGRTKWLPHATREVEVVLGEIRQAESVRAVVVDEAAEELGFEQPPSLRELAEDTPDEWKDIFAAHRRAFLELTNQIHEISKSNRDSLSANQQAANDALMSIEDELQTYDPRGQASKSTAATRTYLVDEAL